ncbi:M23 family metallopeptidase [Psychrobacillus sp. NPDC093180]|uniref:M23 family metallopeptidase n=1 Tax=Psychrobacillus sp. NPDC093180 TaxID=3364489 RepID=UPI003828D6DA
MYGSLADPEDFGTIFLNEDYENIYYCTSIDFQKLISLEQFVELASTFNGGVNYYQIEFNLPFQDMTHYIWVDDQKEKAISVFFDEKKRIQRLYLKPFITYEQSDNRFTVNLYTMPVKGEWFVFWGGANEFINYHYPYESQRYAYDLVKVQDGLSYRNTQTGNNNFYAFGEDIVAPGDGKIVKVVDGLKDNIPGEMDTNNPAGNYVVIEHANKEFSMIAHFKQNSILVKVGVVVTEGQLIGKCGNSGNSSEPHIHFQVMDSPDFENGNSIRIRFKDGNEPIQGDTVVNPLDYKDPFDEKLNKMDNSLTMIDFILLIPRTIAQFFKN